MVKAQDCMILLKLLANPKKAWSQRQLAHTLQISLSEINTGIKRLIVAGLLRVSADELNFVPILGAAEEFIVHSIKYNFPVQLGAVTRGIPTSTGAPLFKDKIALGDDLVPVWPDARGELKGVALEPIHPAVTKALQIEPDELFYELLVLVDAIRQGRSLERNLAIQLLKERLNNE